MVHPKVEERLRQCGVKYHIREHCTFGAPIKSPSDFARVQGYSIERITKSLLLHGQLNREFVLAVCSANKKLDFVGIAKLLNCGRLRLATAEELLSKTGYPTTGVSPIGVDCIKVIVDEGVLAYETILVGSGVVGVEVEIVPNELVTCLKAMVNRIVL